MTSWEYATVPLLVHATKQILDSWGEDGWGARAGRPRAQPEQLVAYLEAAEVMTPEERLAELGLALPSVAAPVAAYVPAVRTGSYVYTSGQLPLVDGKLVATGKVGAEVLPDQAKELAVTCMLNSLAAIRRGGLTVRGAQDRQGGGLRCERARFSGQPEVVNGAGELLNDVFRDAGQHARSAVGVAVLPAMRPSRSRSSSRSRSLRGR